MNLLEKSDCVVKHVCSPGELILRLGDLFGGEELGLDEVGEEGKGEVPVEVRDDRLRQIVFRHSGRRLRLNKYFQKKRLSCLQHKEITNKNLQGYHTGITTLIQTNTTPLGCSSANSCSPVSTQ